MRGRLTEKTWIIGIRVQGSGFRVHDFHNEIVD
jgi:hypothetical protein